MSDHLFVLVHGLWGNPGHLWCVKESLQKRHPEARILVSKVNQGNLTYDGVDVCGERIADEVTAYLQNGQNGTTEASSMASSSTLQRPDIRHISFVGYSFGGLAARYAIGILQERKVFDNIEPVTFTTFAAPHVGVSPTSKGFFSWLASSIGPRSLSMTGAHLFLADDYWADSERSTRAPLLQVMADERSIFHAGLKRFRQRQAYANILFDRSVPYWTASFSTHDPYTDLSKVQLQHDPAYDNVVLDRENPVQPLGKTIRPFDKKDQPAEMSTRDYILRASLFALLPIWLTVFVINAMVLTFRSQKRIASHRQGERGPGLRDRARLLAGLAQDMVEEVLDNAPEEQQGLAHNGEPANAHHWVAPLALTSTQRQIIAGLSALEWEKYPVHIHKTQHSHAAIVCRMKDTPRVEEGKIVMQHWLDHLVEPRKNTD